MVRNYLDQNILHTYYNLGINGHPNETVTGAYNTLCKVSFGLVGKSPSYRNQDNLNYM